MHSELEHTSKLGNLAKAIIYIYHVMFWIILMLTATSIPGAAPLAPEDNY